MEFEDSNSTFIGTVKVTLLQDFRFLAANITVMSLKSKIIYFDKTINACFFAKQRKSNLIFRFMLDDVFKYANFRFECPFKKVKCKAGKISYYI